MPPAVNRSLFVSWVRNRNLYELQRRSRPSEGSTKTPNRCDRVVLGSRSVAICGPMCGLRFGFCDTTLDRSDILCEMAIQKVVPRLTLNQPTQEASEKPATSSATCQSLVTDFRPTKTTHSGRIPSEVNRWTTSSTAGDERRELSPCSRRYFWRGSGREAVLSRTRSPFL